MNISNNYSNIGMMQNADKTKGAYIPPERKAEPINIAKSDKIELSSKGNHQKNIGGEVKQYVNAINAAKAGSSERIEILKQQYAGDNVPVSGQDIAEKILNKMFAV